MGATTIFYFTCKTNILHIISRFYAGIRLVISSPKLTKKRG